MSDKPTMIESSPSWRKNFFANTSTPLCPAVLNLMAAVEETGRAFAYRDDLERAGFKSLEALAEVLRGEGLHVEQRTTAGVLIISKP